MRTFDVAGSVTGSIVRLEHISPSSRPDAGNVEANASTASWLLHAALQLVLACSLVEAIETSSPLLLLATSIATAAAWDTPHG